MVGIRRNGTLRTARKQINLVGDWDVENPEDSNNYVDIAAPGYRYDVKAYGAAGNDSTDDTTSINNAYVDAAAAGGTVVFPVGSYRTSSPINMHGTAGSAAKGVVTRFEGRENITRVKPLANFNTGTSAGAVVFNCSPTTSAASPSWAFENMYVDNTLATTVTSLYLNNLQLVRVKDCKFRLGAIGIDIGIVSAGNFEGIDCYNQTTAGYRYAAGTDTNSQGHNWSGCTFFYTAGSVGDGNAGWLDLSGHQDQWYHNCTVLRTPGIANLLPYGFKIDGSAATAPGQTWFLGCEVDAITNGSNGDDGSDGAGFWMDHINHVRIQQCWISSLDTGLTDKIPGIYINNCDDVSIDNNYISGQGLVFGSGSATDMVAIRGNHFPNAEQTDPCIAGIANVTNLNAFVGNSKAKDPAPWFDNYAAAQTAYSDADVQFGYGVLKKAGAPADADFVATPPNGTIALDTTNHRIYMRDGGVWKFAALT